MAPAKGQDVAANLSKLSLDGHNKTAQKNKKKHVADSWEDESSSASEAEDRPSHHEVPPSPAPQGPGSKAPPPTPITSSYNHADSSLPWDSYASAGAGSSGPLSPDQERRRPEKTDAVARRMIASALGVKVPRMTEEQRAYDRSVKDQERKRRELEKAAEAKRKQDAEKAKAAMWDD